MPRSGRDDPACLVNYNFPIYRTASWARLNTGGIVTRPRAADDFPAIRARIEELRRQRARVPAHAAADGTLRQAAGPRALSDSSRPGAADKPGLSPAIRRAFLKLRTG